MIRATSLALGVLAIGVVLGYAAAKDDAPPATVAGSGPRVTVTETVVRTTARSHARTGRRARSHARTGRRVYLAAGCGRCHTLGRRSATKVNLADLDPTYEVVVEAVTKGGILMPAFGNRLSPREIRNVAAFVDRAIE